MLFLLAILAQVTSFAAWSTCNVPNLRQPYRNLLHFKGKAIKSFVCKTNTLPLGHHAYIVQLPKYNENVK